jgi:hypothetical protein
MPLGSQIEQRKVAMLWEEEEFDSHDLGLGVREAVTWEEKVD